MNVKIEFEVQVISNLKITTDEELVISKSQLEPPLNRNPSDDIAKLWEAINEMKSLLLKSWTTNTSIREASVAEPQGTSLSPHLFFCI